MLKCYTRSPVFGDRGPVLAQLQLPTERCTNCLRSWCDGSPTPSVTIQPTLLHSHEKHHGREQQKLELKEKFHASHIPQPTISVHSYDRHHRIQCSQQYQLKLLSPAIQVVFDFATRSPSNPNYFTAEMHWHLDHVGGGCLPPLD